MKSIILFWLWWVLGAITITSILSFELLVLGMTQLCVAFIIQYFTFGDELI